jgi:YacP-like NYN domain
VLVVDGMNVIGSRPDGWWRDRPGAQRRLVAELAERGEPLTVVFDGAPHDTAPPEHVEVRFAPHADDVIAELAGPGVRVVTSDRALAERARAKGADVLGAKAFRDYAAVVCSTTSRMTAPPFSMASTVASAASRTSIDGSPHGVSMPVPGP